MSQEKRHCQYCKVELAWVPQKGQPPKICKGTACIRLRQKGYNDKKAALKKSPVSYGPRLHFEATKTRQTSYIDRPERNEDESLKGRGRPLTCLLWEDGWGQKNFLAGA